MQSCTGSVGILGIILSILVLSTKQMRNSFNILLIVLSSFEILFITIAILDYGMARANIIFLSCLINIPFGSLYLLPNPDSYLISVFRWPFSHDSELYAIMFPKFLFPVNNIIFNSSIFLTIVIAYERYYEANIPVFDSFLFRFRCVCRPHQYRHSTLGTSISRRVASYVVPTDLAVCAALTNTASAPWALA